MLPYFEHGDFEHGGHGGVHGGHGSHLGAQGLLLQQGGGHVGGHGQGQGHGGHGWHFGGGGHGSHEAHCSSFFKPLAGLLTSHPGSQQFLSLDILQ